MPLEYLVYIVVPFIVGLFGEQYKDTNTKNYAIFIFFVLVFIYIYTALMHRPVSWKLDRDSFFIYIAGFVLCTGIFHFQKVGRRMQKERREAKLKNKDT